MRIPASVSGVAFFFALCAPALRADVTLPVLFGDHMVLQRGMEIAVWGTAAPGERVTVGLADHSATAETDPQGRWRVMLPKMEAGGPHELTVRGKNAITLRDVLVGEVWICSGQSNMAWPVSKTHNGTNELAAADHPRLRLFQVRKTRASQPLGDVAGQWRTCTPEAVKDFSAVAYFFGRDLQKHLNVPVGLIEAAWGGTPVEHWIPAAQYEAQPELLQPADALLTGRSELYNGMIAPLTPLSLRGVIWYQGEANTRNAASYGARFRALIRGWRQAWRGRSEFPFLFVQIAPFDYTGRGRPPYAAPLVREGQLAALELKNTAMVVTTDVGDARDIHPRDKQTVGRRLARAARALVYGERDLVHSGPTFKSLEIRGDRAVVHFDGLGSGLTLRGERLTEFQIAGADRRFVNATARIAGETVVVHSDEVRQPIAVRFAFCDAPQPNLFNKEGFPATPFRTDDWPLDRAE